MYTVKFDKLIEDLRVKGAEILSGGSRLALYGSCTRGDGRPDSEWDIHILILGPEKLRSDIEDDIAWEFDSIGLKFGEIINSRVYSFTGWLKRKFLPFYKNVESEKIAIVPN